MNQTRRMRVPYARALADNLTEEMGREVVAAELIEVKAGQRVTLTFLSATSPWAQGVWIATEGTLAIGEHRSPQFTLWMRPEQPVVHIDVEETDGAIRFYNIWDDGKVRPHHSLGYTSGMIRTDLPDGTIEYRCNDTGPQREFDRLVFTVRVD